MKLNTTLHTSITAKLKEKNINTIVVGLAHIRARSSERSEELNFYRDPRFPPVLAAQTTHYKDVTILELRGQKVAELTTIRSKKMNRFFMKNWMHCMR